MKSPFGLAGSFLVSIYDKVIYSVNQKVLRENLNHVNEGSKQGMQLVSEEN